MTTTTQTSDDGDDHRDVAATALTESAVRRTFGRAQSDSAVKPRNHNHKHNNDYDRANVDSGDARVTTTTTCGSSSSSRRHCHDGATTSCASLHARRAHDRRLLVRPASRTVSDVASLCSTVQSVLPRDDYERLLYRPRRHLLQCAVTRLRHDKGNEGSHNSSSSGTGNSSSGGVWRSWMQRLRGKSGDAVDCFALEHTHETLLCAVTGDYRRARLHRATLSWRIDNTVTAPGEYVLQKAVPVALLCRADAVVARNGNDAIASAAAASTSMTTSSTATAPSLLPQPDECNDAATTTTTTRGHATTTASFATLLADEVAATTTTTTGSTTTTTTTWQPSPQRPHGARETGVYGVVCRCADTNTFVLLGKRRPGGGSGGGNTTTARHTHSRDVRSELGVLWFSVDAEGRPCVTVVLPAALSTTDVAHTVSAHTRDLDDDDDVNGNNNNNNNESRNGTYKGSDDDDDADKDTKAEVARVHEGSSALLREYARDAQSARLCVLHSRPPQWDNATRTFRLSQHTRVRVASEKNVELVYDDRGGHDDRRDAGASRLVMVFGKHSDDRYVMDFRQPLCGLQAAFVATALLHRRDYGAASTPLHRALVR